MTDRFATLNFERQVSAPVSTLWQAWTAPAARAVWASPAPEVTVEFIEADTRIGGREISICRVAGQPDIQVDGGWLVLQDAVRSVGHEMISCEGDPLSAALVTADFTTEGTGSRVAVTVQISSLSEDMVPGYQQGFGAGMDNLADVANRTMVLSRVIDAPRHVVWGAWLNPETLPQWWGPDGFSCRTDRIDLQTGGEWVFDMIAPDGTVFPNHHLYSEVRNEDRIAYALLSGENGPKHADAWASFEETDGRTTVTLGMIFSTASQYSEAKGFGAEKLGLQTLGKLASFVGAA